MALQPHALATMLLTVLALVLFTSERIRLETSSLVVLGLLLLGFSAVPLPHAELEVVEFFSGMGHEALVAVMALMVIGQGLVRTGALQPVGRWLGALWLRTPLLAFGLVLLLAAALSAFVNNTPIVVLLLPILVSVSLKTRRPASSILMPMGFATLVGGMCTTIGTSTNLLVVSVAADLGVPRLGMFDFAAPAALAGVVALLYLWLVAPRLLPIRELPLGEGSPRLFNARLRLLAEGFGPGGTLSELRKRLEGRVQVQRVRRGKAFLLPLPDLELQADDRLVLRGTAAQLKAVEEAVKGTLYVQDDPVDEDHPLKAEDQALVELAITPGSDLDRASLRRTRFLDRFQLAVLGLHRNGTDIWRPGEELPDVRLGAGDVLLVQGPLEQIEQLKRGGELLVLDGGQTLPAASGTARRALLITAVTIGTAALGVLPIAVSAALGATAMLLARCLDWEQALRALSVPVFFVVVASLALGRALVDTGATDWIGWQLLALLGDAPRPVLLAALMGLMAVVTNVVSNNAAAVIGTPIAIGIAQTMQVDPTPFILAVLFGANMSFATPMAYKTNLLVLNAGNYTFTDFVRIGVPLTLIMWITLTAILVVLYP